MPGIKPNAVHLTKIRTNMVNISYFDLIEGHRSLCSGCNNAAHATGWDAFMTISTRKAGVGCLISV